MSGVQWPRSLAAPSRIRLLHAVEAAQNEFDEAVALLEACGVDDCVQLPVGILDRLLLQAYRLVLGRDLEAVFACPACGTLNALALAPGDVAEYEPRWAWCGPGAGVREPIGADLMGLPSDPDDAAAEIARRCSTGPATGDRDDDALDRADQSLCGAVHLTCVDCGQPVDGYLDVQQLVTSAVATAVADVDVEIHLIASRYGWDLATIEALPERRRVRLAALASGGRE
ncbi:hypothetical protein ACPPVO_36345 [Dactylosporangium sp. McL0621]|uniref:hypothetical protein n=1 Tax=Dactylosporangium sp. McL0621 TaxID=3415678 RepID=UPI003CFB4E86